MAVAGLVAAVVALTLSISATAVFFFSLHRIRRAYLAHTAVMLARIEELDRDIRRLSEGGYVLARMLMEKGVMEEDEFHASWKLLVEDARDRVREHAELLREWKERADNEGADAAVLVDEIPKRTH